MFETFRHLTAAHHGVSPGGPREAAPHTIGRLVEPNLAGVSAQAVRPHDFDLANGLGPRDYASTAVELAGSF